MQLLKQSTGVDVRIGPAVDATDAVTPETTLALGTADQAELLKHNGAATVDISARTFAAVTGCDGWYDLTLTTADTDTVGMVTIVVQDASLMLPIFKDFMVVPANAYDSLVGGTDTLQADVTQWLGTAAATPTTAGVPEVDVTYWLGTAAAAPTVAGVPEVDVTHWLGSSVGATVSGIPNVNIALISESSIAAANLEESAEVIQPGQAATGTLTTTIFTTNLNSTHGYTTDDALNGRSLTFKGDVTAALEGQGGVISDYSQATGQVTISTPLTTAPANLDSFVIT